MACQQEACNDEEGKDGQTWSVFCSWADSVSTELGVWGTKMVLLAEWVDSARPPMGPVHHGHCRTRIREAAA